MKRLLFDREKVKRGCRYCADVIVIKVKTGADSRGNTLYCEKAKYCPYPECPYRELDKCRSFVAYLKQMEKKYGTVAKMLGDTFKQRQRKNEK